MKNKKGMEMTISTIVVLVLALILLAIGIYLIYTKILKPSEGATSAISCESRGGAIVQSYDDPICVGAVKLRLPSDAAKGELVNCCIKEIK